MTSREPNGNHHHHYYPPTTTSSSSSASFRGCCCCLFLLFSFLALLILAVILINLLAVKPKKPEFDLQQVGIQYLKLGFRTYFLFIALWCQLLARFCNFCGWVVDFSGFRVVYQCFTKSITDDLEQDGGAINERAFAHLGVIRWCSGMK